MKTPNKLRTLITLQLFVLATAAQDYTWKKGDNVINKPAKVGVPGSFAPANTPGARDGVVTWKDSNGKFWLFGGFGVDVSSYNTLNDLWKYDPAINQWALMKGDSIGGRSGVYGTKGVSSSSNYPGARYQAISWIDASGNFWMFGGNAIDENAQQGFMNDLWRYTPSTNQWTWMSGAKLKDQAGTHGTLGTASPANVPGAREGAVSWADNSGNLWLFGGWGWSGNSQVGMLNDLWRYNITSGQWTWMYGSSSYDVNGTYGTQGTGSSSNVPGGRRYSSAWTDLSGNFWLLGGYGSPATGLIFGHMNDLWKYSPTANQWTWIKGSNSIDQLGVYGTKGTPSPGNVPGSRSDAFTWTDSGGNLWMLGGAAFGYTIQTSDYMNDLWRYNIASNQWTWIRGGNSISQAGVYGTQGVPSPLNTPGGRLGGGAWIDASDNLWLFGGSGYDTNSQTSSGWLNDLWKFGSCISQTVSISPSSPSACKGSTLSLAASGASTYAWSTTQTLSTIVVTADTVYTFSVSSNDPNSCGSVASVTLTVHDLPAVQASTSNTMACTGTSVTLTATGAQTYSWSSGHSGAQIMVPASTATYVVTGVDANGCKGQATLAQYAVICNGIKQQFADNKLRVFPNPNSGSFAIGGEGNNDLIIYDATGRRVRMVENYAMGSVIESGLAPGVYFVKVQRGFLTARVVVE